MNCSSHWNRSVFILFGLGVLASSGCGMAGDAVPVRAETAGEAPRPRVATVTPERMTLRRIASEPGQVEAFETTEILARVAGYVRQMAVDIGDRVEAGQLLAALEAPELVAELERCQAHLDQDIADLRRAEAMVEVARTAVETARAGVDAARAAIRRAEAEVSRWQAEYDRIDRLVRDRAVTEGLRDETQSKLEAAKAAREEVEAEIRLAEAALDQSEAEHVRSQTDVAVGEAHVRVAEADLRHAEAMVSYTRITAPFDGVITKRYVDTGHLTEPGGSRDPLFTIARTDTVRVSIGVPEVDAPLVKVGAPAEVRVPVLGGRVVEGVVSRISWALDRSTRTLRAEIDLDNPGQELQSGLYVYASIIAAERENALSLPVSAIVKDPEGVPFCMVLVDGKVRRQLLEIGLSDGSRVEIVSGLADEDVVITSEPGSLQEGQAVEAIDPAT